MSKQYKVVIVGFAHMHINDVGAAFHNHPRLDIVACADLPAMTEELNHGPYTRQWNLDFACRNFAIKNVYDDYREMLDREQPDLAIITSENVYHPQIVAECARRGIGACIEKPMAMNLSDALAIRDAIETHGSFALVNWPVTWRPWLHQMKQLIDEGSIGRLIGLQYRAGHTGPLGPGAQHRGVSETADAMTPEEKGQTWWHQAKCGGGAMVDMCCYGSLFGTWFTGVPALSVMAMKANFASTYGDVEDNAAMLVRFPEAIAMVEGTWTTPRPLAQAGPVVYGETGALTCLRKGGDVLVQCTDVHNNVETYPVAVLDKHLTNVATAYVHAMDTGEPLHETLSLETNLRTMAILDAGIRSTQSGREEPVQDIAAGGRE